MDFRILALLLLVASLSYADCIGYNDSFQVRVLDAKLRPIENAVVTVTYDRGASFGDQYFTTPPTNTDADGMVRVDINNQGTLNRAIDCAIVINTTVGTAFNSTTVTANEHGPTVDLQLGDVYPLHFRVLDQTGTPLQGAVVTIENDTRTTGSDGSVDYYEEAGAHDYFASYLDASQPGTLNISDDTNFAVKFTYYRISVSVSDDYNNPLPAEITIFNNTFQMSGGIYQNNKTFGVQVPYSVDYKGITQDGIILSDTAPDVKVVYDLHSPVIGNIQAEALNDQPRLVFSVTDPGLSPSGVDISSVSVTYRMEPADASTPWDKAVIFTTGPNEITADFNPLPANKIVSFRIDAKDKAGNNAEVDGKFTTYAVNSTQNTTQNQTNTQQPGTESQGIPLLYIVIVVVLIVLAAYAVFRIKSKGPGGS